MNQLALTRCLLLAAAVSMAATTACSSASVVPASGPISAPAVAPSASGDPTADPTDPTGDVDPSRTVALPMSVRVVNLYLPKGDTPTPIEVWTGPPANGGQKLATVPYGQASAYFAPRVSDPAGQGPSGINTDYSLSFYASGHTGPDDELMNQGEKSAPGQKLTMVAFPGDPDSNGLSMQVLADALGSAPQGSGFTSVSLPTPPAGRSMLSINATALEYRNGGSDLSLTPSTTTGKCLPYLEPDTGKLHDMSADTLDLVGGTTSLSYPLTPGTTFRLNRVQDQQSVSDACADTPVAGPFDPGLSAGHSAYGFLFGSSLKASKFLVVPTS